MQLTTQLSIQLALMSSVLVMGFLGSWHCGVMCGPLSCNFKKQQDFFTYHLGRLISYLMLASFLFYGSSFFLTTDSRWLRLLASLVFGLLFIYFGLIQLTIFKNSRWLFGYYKLQFRLLKKNKSLYLRFPVMLGLLTGLFPCGWLYTFLLLSSQMKSWPQSMLLVLIFWFTSLPAFIVFTGFMQNLIKNSPVRYQTLSGVVLIMAGLFSVIGHWFSIILL